MTALGSWNVLVACIFSVIYASPTHHLRDGSSRIVGGTRVNLGDIPWQVSLYKYSEGQHVCGGSILGHLWILTAAHCVHNADQTEFVVHAGLISLSNPGPSEQNSSVTQIILHEAFNPDLGTFGANDLALLKLGKRLIFGPFVYSINLPSAGYVAGGNGIASGWGALQENGPLSDALNQVTLPILSLMQCKEYYGDDMNEKLLCAGFDEGQKDACQGDSGGPLTCDDQNVLCGIISAGDGCAREGVPGIYTNVVFFLDWLAQNMLAPISE